MMMKNCARARRNDDLTVIEEEDEGPARVRMRVSRFASS